MILSTIISASLFVICTAAPVPKLTPTTLRATARWSHMWNKNGAPCGMNDMECMNTHGLELVNDLRKSKGLALFKIGAKGMLKNAVDHSKEQEKKGNIWHQNLSNVKVCDFDCVGENVSMNHIFFADPNIPSDPVKQCFEQFLGSPPHKKNMLTKHATHFAMGTVFDKDSGYIFCTQTFWDKVNNGSGDCVLARR